MTKWARLEQRIRDLEQERAELLADRAKFREHFQVRFQWWVKLMKENSSPNLAWLVENDAKWLQQFKYWVW